MAELFNVPRHLTPSLRERRRRPSTVELWAAVGSTAAAAAMAQSVRMAVAMQPWCGSASLRVLLRRSGQSNQIIRLASMLLNASYCNLQCVRQSGLLCSLQLVEPFTGSTAKRANRAALQEAS